MMEIPVDAFPRLAVNATNEVRNTKHSYTHKEDKAAVRNSNDCTICDSTRDQHLMKTAVFFLEVSPSLLSLDMLDIQSFPNLI